MKEVKSPRKPLLYYYLIAIGIIFLFNILIVPMLMQGQISEVDYGTFMHMIEEQDIGRVEIEDSQIVFTNKDNTKLYKTGSMDDPTLTQRLYESGATFSKDIQQTISPLMSILLTVGLPLLIFILLGRYMSKKLMEQAGGKNAMAFGMGKSNAKVYVQSTQGILFCDVYNFLYTSYIRTETVSQVQKAPCQFQERLGAVRFRDSEYRTSSDTDIQPGLSLKDGKIGNRFLFYEMFGMAHQLGKRAEEGGIRTCRGDHGQVYA